jgi:hypothetical protein
MPDGNVMRTDPDFLITLPNEPLTNRSISAAFRRATDLS